MGNLKNVYELTDVKININKKQFCLSPGYYFFRLNEISCKTLDIINTIKCD